MQLRFICVLVGCFIINSGYSAVATAAPDAKEKTEQVVELTEAEKLVFEEQHLKEVNGHQSLIYSFERTSVFGDAFKDEIKLDVRDEAEAGYKSISFEFFSKDRRRPYPSFSNVATNPLLVLYFNKDAWDLARRIKAKGTVNYLRNRIMDAIGDVKKIDEITVQYNGKDIKAKRITFSPYAKDKNRHNFVHYADIEYQMVLSSEIPGMLYEIISRVPPHDGEIPAHFITRLKKGGMISLATESEKVNKLKITDKPLIMERLRFKQMEKVDG